MKTRSARRLMVLAVCISFAAASALAQVATEYPARTENDGVLGPQLIAWSVLQKPQPVPQQAQPIPGPDTAQLLSSTAQDKPPQSTQQPEPETQQTTAQSVSGTIAKIGNNYVLRTADNLTYQLDDQRTAGQYLGKHVKVTGNLDPATGIIRVRSIELLS